MQEEATPEDRFGLEGTTLADRYVVDRMVAQGGYAVVYHAVQLGLERPVALKVLRMPAGLDDVARGRFRNRFATEARTLARLGHTNVVSVYDYGISRMGSGEIAPWMALEWLDGETLETNLDRRRGSGGRPVASAVAMLRPVIELIAHCHRRGIVHRDIKPANIMIVATDEGPALRMLDFGIAKLMEDRTTGPGASSGAAGFSPHYAAPEQVTFTRTGPFTDVHALGLILTELLTDEPPYAEGPEEHVLEQVMLQARPTPKAKSVDAGRIEKVIAKAVAFAPRRRWKTAGELLDAIDALEILGPYRAREDGRATVKVKRGASRTPAPARTTSEWEAPTAEWDYASTPGLQADAAVPWTRRQTLAAAIVGGIAVAGALGLLIWTLAGGRSRSSSAGHEMATAVRAKRAAAAARGELSPPRSTPSDVTPFIVPIAGGAAPPLSGDQKRRAARSVEPCALTINSIPWSEVWIDGGNTGRHTPLVNYVVPCGKHRLAFRRADLALEESELVTLTPGEPFKKVFALVQGG